MHEERAGGELHLRRVVIEIEERESGGGTQAKGRIAHVELGTRVLIGPEPVAGREWPVERRGGPVLNARRLQRH